MPILTPSTLAISGAGSIVGGDTALGDNDDATYADADNSGRILAHFDATSVAGSATAAVAFCRYQMFTDVEDIFGPGDYGDRVRFFLYTADFNTVFLSWQHGVHAVPSGAIFEDQGPWPEPPSPSDVVMGDGSWWTFRDDSTVPWATAELALLYCLNANDLTIDIRWDGGSNGAHPGRTTRTIRALQLEIAVTASSAYTRMPPARLTGRMDGLGPLGGPRRLDTTGPSRQSGFHPGSPGSYY